MRRWNLLSIITVFVLSALVAATVPARADDYSHVRIVRLSLVQGDVQITQTDEQGWEPAIANMPIQQGYSIGTNDGRAVVEFENGATAYIAEKTVVQFTELALSDGGRITRLTLMQGTATIYANPQSADSFAILTSQLTVTLSGRAQVRVDLSNDGSSVTVEQGEVSVDTSSGTQLVSKGSTLTSSTAGDIQMERNRATDDWDRWVSSNGNQPSSSYSTANQYANAPFQYGMSDLSTYGSWNYYPDYGYLWRPLSYGNGWAPFCDGQWIYYRGLGWTWVSFEPWGWVPYHFGNWVFIGGGWAWLPGGFNSWRAAPVRFLRVGNRIAWMPIQPAAVAGRQPHVTPPIVVGSSHELGGRGSNRIVDNVREIERAHVVTDTPPPLGRGPRVPHSTGPAPTPRPAGLPSANVVGGAKVILTTPRPIPNTDQPNPPIVFVPAEHRYVGVGPTPVQTENPPVPGGPAKGVNVLPAPAPLVRSVPGPPPRVVPTPPVRPASAAPAPRPIPTPPVRVTPPPHATSPNPPSPAPPVSTPRSTPPHSSPQPPHSSGPGRPR
jgi:hypothetical protein